MITCSVCGHEHDEEEWDGHEFSVNPSIQRESHSFRELRDLFNAYHTAIPRHVIDDGYQGYEMNFDVPEKGLFEVFKEEAGVALDQQQRTEKERLGYQAMKEEYAEKLGTHNFYILDDEIHHFRYMLDAQASTDDYKHVCDECYDVIFD